LLTIRSKLVLNNSLVLAVEKVEVNSIHVRKKEKGIIIYFFAKTKRSLVNVVNSRHKICSYI
jgi:hypothetical protein